MDSILDRFKETDRRIDQEINFSEVVGGRKEQLQKKLCPDSPSRAPEPERKPQPTPPSQKAPSKGVKPQKTASSGSGRKEVVYKGSSPPDCVKNKLEEMEKRGFSQNNCAWRGVNTPMGAMVFFAWYDKGFVKSERLQ
ncbi:MAG: hypothetical protein AAB877_00185 [Patescibacteria group bacterium]